MPRLNRDPPTGGDDYVESDDPHRHAEMQWGHVTAHIYCLRTIPLMCCSTLDVFARRFELEGASALSNDPTRCQAAALPAQRSAPGLSRTSVNYADSPRRQIA
jgi:hypothetical protein